MCLFLHLLGSPFVSTAAETADPSAQQDRKRQNNQLLQKLNDYKAKYPVKTKKHKALE